MSRSRIGRGQPIFALVAVLGGWAGGRAATWTPPAVVPQAVALQTPAPRAEASEGFVVDGNAGPQSLPAPTSPISPAEVGHGSSYAYGPGVAVPPGNASAGYMPSGWKSGAVSPASPEAAIPASAVSPIASAPTSPSPAEADDDGWNAVSQLLRLPGVSQSGFSLGGGSPRFFAPEKTAPAAPGAVPQATPAAPARPRPRRWSADTWALLRRETDYSKLSAGALPASYGASQAGAVLRYRLSLKDEHRPSLYLRTTSSLGRTRQKSAAAGLSARPLAGLPVVAAVEARFTRQGGIQILQPTAMAVTEMAPFRLPANLQGELYLQGGYVAGRYGTPFADGQLRIDHALWSKGLFQTRLGGGIWGGAQSGASRLDVGPSASLALPIGKGLFGRVAVDWRFRMAGDAQPGSGPALTLSAGF